MGKLNNIRRLLAIVVLLSGAVIVAIIGAKYKRGKQAAVPPPRQHGNIDVSLDKIHYSETENGSLKWELVADKAEYDRARDLTMLYAVNFTLSGRGRNGNIRLTADRADYENSSKNVSLSGSVRAVSDSGMEVVSDRLRYDAAASLLETAGRVRLKDGNLSVEGVGMEFRTKENSLRILSDVTAVVQSGIRP